MSNHILWEHSEQMQKSAITFKAWFIIMSSWWIFGMQGFPYNSFEELKVIWNIKMCCFLFDPENQFNKIGFCDEMALEKRKTEFIVFGAV